MSSRDQRSDTVMALNALSRDPGAREGAGLDAINPLPFIAGALLSAYGLKRRGVLGYFLTGVGVGVAYRAARDEQLFEQDWQRRLLHTAAREMAPIQHTIAINRSPAEVYAFWREIENLAIYLPRIHNIERIDDARSTWSFKGPGDMLLKSEVELIDDQPERLLVWRAIEPSDIFHEGWVSFAPIEGGAATEVDLHLRVLAPGGKTGARLVELLGRMGPLSPAGDLARIREVLEAGIPDRVEAASSTLH
ncbi:SRPBCC family protein [Lujinxingia sediminis]|nr:SRPBCC family protein [Lujinxingia sediminis]